MNILNKSDVYTRLTQIMPFNLVMEAIFTVNEGIRIASSAPIDVSLKAKKLLEGTAQDIFTFYFIFRNMEMLNTMRGEIDNITYFEMQKDMLKEVCTEIANILTRILSKRVFHIKIKKLGLKYKIDVHPLIGESILGCGVTRYNVQDITNKVKKEALEKIVSDLPFPRPLVSLIFFRRENEETVENKYSKIIEVRNKKLMAINGIFATKESIDHSIEEARLFGELMNYPSCCIESYVKSKRELRINELYKLNNKLISPEEKIIKETLSSGIYEFLTEKLFKSNFKIIEIIKSEIPSEFYSIPFNNFYPCTINCQLAIEIGERIKELAAKIDAKISDAYKAGLIGRFLSKMMREIPKYEIKLVGKFRNLWEEGSFSHDVIEKYVSLIQYELLLGRISKTDFSLERAAFLYNKKYSPY